MGGGRAGPGAVQGVGGGGTLYALKTNLPPRDYPLAAVLAEYKGQSTVERRVHQGAPGCTTSRGRWPSPRCS